MKIEFYIETEKSILNRLLNSDMIKMCDLKSVEIQENDINDTIMEYISTYKFRLIKIQFDWNYKKISGFQRY